MGQRDMKTSYSYTAQIALVSNPRTSALRRGKNKVTERGVIEKYDIKFRDLTQETTFLAIY